MAEIVDLPVHTGGTGAGAARDVYKLREKYVQIQGTFSATLQLQGSVDGANWVNLELAQTQPGLVSVPETVALMRVNTTGYVSGTPVCTLCGHRERK